MTKKSKIWYSFLGGKSEDDDIGFYDKNQFEWTELLEHNYEIIKKEIQDYINKNDNEIKPYFNKNLVTKENSWRTFAFSLWCWKVNKTSKECPKTNEIINQIPNLISACISILEPEVEIKRHRGDTNAIVRAHLALEAPVQLPDCGFEVNNQQKSWEEGKIFIFNDAAIHNAWNRSKKRRYVLLIDVLRPEYNNKKYTVCSMVLGGLVMQSILQKLTFLKKFPKFILAPILFTHVAVINLVLRLRSALSI